MKSSNSAKNVISVYLPERGEMEAIAVDETRRLKKPVTTGAIIRQACRAFIEARQKESFGKPSKLPKSLKARKGDFVVVKKAKKQKTPHAPGK